MTTRIVDSDRLGQTDDAYADTTLDGRLFSGIAYERDSSGQLVGVYGYVDGKPHGPLRSWHGSGQIVTEHYYDGGGLHGPYRQWYPDGRPRLDAYYEHGYRTRAKRWSEDGSVLEDEQLDPGSPVAAKIAERRRRRKPHIIDIDLRTWDFVERPPGWGADPADLPAASGLTPPAFPARDG